MKSVKNIKLLGFIFFCFIVIAGLTDSSKTYAADILTDSAEIEIKNEIELARFDQVVVTGEKSYDFSLPCEGTAGRVFNITNTSNEQKIIEIPDLSDMKIEGKLAKYFTNQAFIIFPQPGYIFLHPNETKQLTLTFSASNDIYRDINKVIKKSPLNFTFSLKVFTGMEQGKSFSVTAKNTVTYLTEKYMKTAKNQTATVKGRVTDSNGKAIKGAKVIVSSGYFAQEIETTTDSKGNYKVKVFPYKSPVRNIWHEYTIRVSKDSYAENSAIVYPKKNKVSKKNIVLKKQSKQLKYKNTKVIDLGLQAYFCEGTKDGKIIGFVPFHSDDVPRELVEKDKLQRITLTDKTGNAVLSEGPFIQIPDQAPMFDISDNGRYLAYIYGVNNGHSYPIIKDLKTGKDVYQKTDLDETYGEYENQLTGGFSELHTRCIQLSPDNNYLAVGSADSDGCFWFIDWKNDKILWTARLYGQIRTIHYSEDGKYIYLSSGSGYYHCFDTKGKEIWRTYVIGWATGVSISSDSIAITTKNGLRSLFVLDKKTGKVKWTYDTVYRGSNIKFSPDGTKIWWGNDIAGGGSDADNLVFDAKKGKVLWVLDRTWAQTAFWSGNGKYLAVKGPRHLFVYDAKTGERLFSQKVVLNDEGENAYSVNSSLWMSKDGKYIVAPFNNDERYRTCGQAYYFKLSE